MSGLVQESFDDSQTIWTASSEFGTYRLCEQWIKRNFQTENQIPGPSEWLGMRNWNLSWRNAWRHKFAWRGPYTCNRMIKQWDFTGFWTGTRKICEYFEKWHVSPSSSRIVSEPVLCCTSWGAGKLQTELLYMQTDKCNLTGITIVYDKRKSRWKGNDQEPIQVHILP